MICVPSLMIYCWVGSLPPNSHLITPLFKRVIGVALTDRAFVAAGFAAFFPYYTLAL